jgi:AcrR family transcriptional regulator
MPRAGLDTTAVVQAAAELVNAQGLEALSITRLAAILGVRAPSVYNHVDGLSGLRRELALLGLRGMGECMGEAAIGRSGPPALLAVAKAYRTFIKENPGVYSAGLQASGNMEIVDQEIRQAEERVLRIVMSIIQSFGLEWEEGLHAARALRSLVHGFATLEVSGGFGLPLNLDESFRRLVELLSAGMQEQARASTKT